MNKAPLIIAGVAVMAVGAYMVFQQKALEANPNLQNKIWFRDCMYKDDATPERCIEFVKGMKKAEKEFDLYE